MPSLKNEYFNVYESNMKERAHINRAPLICKIIFNLVIEGDFRYLFALG